MSRMLVAAYVGALAVAGGCSDDSGDTKSPAAGASGGTGATDSGAGGSETGVGGTGGQTGGTAGDSGKDAGVDAFEDTSTDSAGTSDGSSACAPGCGSVELCDTAHLGLDDDCDDQVDEGCPCVPGTSHACFKGDSSLLTAPGCHAGNALCDETGAFGPCVGGVHASAPDNCATAVNAGCHPIEALPFATVGLAAGTGNFSQNAVVGSETFAVNCPPGASTCPQVKAPDAFMPLQSGEYSVTYTKLAQGGSAPESCTFPLLVRAPGLRVELSWEHTTADSGVDLDLHLHEPTTTTPWNFTGTGQQDCNWSNCTANAFSSGAGVSWFANGTPPTPVNWWLDPVVQKNTCYYAPHGVGAEWQSIGMGCHNPRLDLENLGCDASVTDPDDLDFCMDENINIDFPPTAEWTRIGVHYFSNHGLSYPVHPRVKIFCDGSLAADLGPHGYQTPVTFNASDGAGFGGHRFWVVADVAFSVDDCGQSFCAVQPTYSDAITRAPFFTLDTAAGSVFTPAYPAPL